MYIKFAIPKIRTMIFPGIFRKKKDEVHYIGGAEVLPPPLAGEDEAVCIYLKGQYMALLVQTAQEKARL